MLKTLNPICMRNVYLNIYHASIVAYQMERDHGLSDGKKVSVPAIPFSSSRSYFSVVSDPDRPGVALG